ncbi:MAG: ribose 5-phosphate isomerase B [Oscillospiraceae bacterium]|jgi:ribose 5-phosphate isomerase B|nr:ribose 5-phosphate isomerase B [Oscillospiraceae bacterium]
MVVSIASDHAGYDLKETLKNYFDANGISYRDFGPGNTESVDYPIYAKKVCASIQTGESEFGVLVCGTGIGMAIAANKHKNIRAACCHEAYSAKMARLHNDANVLTLGSRITGAGLALEIAKQFLAADFEGGRHSGRVDMINSL